VRFRRFLRYTHLFQGSSCGISLGSLKPAAITAYCALAKERPSQQWSILAGGLSVSNGSAPLANAQAVGSVRVYSPSQLHLPLNNHRGNLAAMQHSIPIKRRRRASEIRKLVDRFRASGLSRADFVRHEGICLATLHRYLQSQSAAHAGLRHSAPPALTSLNQVSAFFSLRALLISKIIVSELFLRFSIGTGHHYVQQELCRIYANSLLRKNEVDRDMH